MQVTPDTSPMMVLHEKHIRIIAVLISFALSAWAVYSDGIVNRDGILYLQAAKQLTQGQWSSALALYDWPFYSGLIALISQAAGLGLETSAQLLNALLFALTVYVFIGLVGELGGNRKVLVAAGLVILLHPQLNEHRADIFRDNGYWAFYLLAVWLFIKYYKLPQLRYALAWGIAIFVTILFRIEGVAFLCLLPLTLLFKRDLNLPRRLLTLAGAWLLGFVGLLLLLVGWVINPEAVMHNIGRLDEPLRWVGYLWHGLSGHLQEQAARLSQAILNQYSENHALHAVIAALIAILAFGVFSALSLVYAVLIFHSFISGTFRTFLAVDMQRIIIGLVAINLVVLSLFLLKMFFLTGRYPMPLALTLMLVLPFHLIALQDRWRMGQIRPLVRTLYLALAGLAVVAVCVDGLVTFGPSKQHIKMAGLWIAHEAPASARLYTNDEVVAYYAGRWQPIDYDGFNETLRQLREGGWRNFDYLAIRAKKHDKALETAARQAVGQEPVKVFVNNHGERLLIFQTHSRSNGRQP